MQTRRSVLASSVAFVLLGSYSRKTRASANNSITRIAFGSCAKQWEPQPIWTAIGNKEPDLFLFLGDAIYGDWHGEEVFSPTPESLKNDWDQLAAIPDFKKFRSHVPIMATWDNHDYGKHDGGAEFGLKEQSKKLFLDFFNEPQNSDRRKRSGIYDSKIFGPDGHRVQVILLDTRTFKSPYIVDERSAEKKAALGIRGQYAPNDNAGATLLGAEQWNWLEQQLRKPAEIRLIASSTQVIADEKAMEEWGNFPLERKRLFDLIGQTGANGVFLLSGNVHFAEISQTDEGPYPLYDFTSSGMTHSTPAYSKLKNEKRLAGPFTDFNFGLVEIEWDTEQGTSLTLSAHNADGKSVFETKISIEALKIQQ